MFVWLEEGDGFGEFLGVVVDGDVVARGDDLVDEFGIDLSDEVEGFLEFVEAVGGIVYILASSTFRSAETGKFGKLVLEVIDEHVAVEADQADEDVLGQFGDGGDEGVFDGCEFLFGEAEVDEEEDAAFSDLGLDVLLDLGVADVDGEGVGGEAEGADPGFGVFVFLGEGVEGGPALGTVEGVGAEEGRVGEEGGEEVAEGHDDFLGGAAGGGQAVEDASPARVLLVLFHVH